MHIFTQPHLLRANTHSLSARAAWPGPRERPEAPGRSDPAGRTAPHGRAGRLFRGPRDRHARLHSSPTNRQLRNRHQGRAPHHPQSLFWKQSPEKRPGGSVTVKLSGVAAQAGPAVPPQLISYTAIHIRISDTKHQCWCWNSQPQADKMLAPNLILASALGPAATVCQRPSLHTPSPHQPCARDRKAANGVMEPQPSR